MLESLGGDICRESALKPRDDTSITELVNLLREQRPALRNIGPRPDDTASIVRSLANVIDTVNALRNKAGVAHADGLLIEEPEARLVINSVRTVLGYVHSRIVATKSS